MLDISVIICSHNPRPQFLCRVLDALRKQTLPMVQWELVLIDNGSQEPLTSNKWDLTWHPHARCIREDRLGLSVARTRGMEEVSAALMVFVDDDNILDPNYLAEAVRIGREWPQLGVWGGSIVPEFEVEPPDHLKEFLGLLAIREIKTPRWSNLITSFEAAPWGAGLCVRVSVANAYAANFRNAAIRLSDRRGASLLSGGDVEICYVACSCGLGMGLFPELKVVHLIPKERIEENYMIRVSEGTQTSMFLLNYKWLGTVPNSPFSVLGLLRFLRDICLYRGIHRKMHLAGIRGAIAARRIIATTRGAKSTSLTHGS